MRVNGEWLTLFNPADDTGWVDILPASGFTSSGAQVRRIGPVVHFKGYRSGQLTTASPATIGTVPPGFLPISGADGSVSGVGLGNGTVARAHVSASGAISVIVPTALNTAVYLKGLSGYIVG